MNNSMLLISVCATLSSFGQVAIADETKKPEQPPAETKPAAEPKPATENKPAEDAKPASDKPAEEKSQMEELEAKFKKTLTNATLTGRWCMVKDGKAGDLKEEKYTITGVTKLFGERWLIHARIQYNNNDYTAPFPVRVKWAGDTPVITVDDVGVPGGAKYSARVMIYDNTYAGKWSGGTHGGLMSGVITNEKE